MNDKQLMFLLGLMSDFVSVSAIAFLKVHSYDGVVVDTAVHELFFFGVTLQLWGCHPCLQYCVPVLKMQLQSVICLPLIKLSLFLSACFAILLVPSLPSAVSPTYQ